MRQVPRKCLTPDDITDPAVRVDAADLLGMCRVHLHLPAKEESLEEGEGTRREGAKFELQNNQKLNIYIYILLIYLIFDFKDEIN